MRGLPIRFKVVAASSTLVILISIFVFLFYPARQKRASIAAMRHHAEQSASMVALGVGLGLERADLTMITTSVGWAKQDSALAFLVAVDSTGGVFTTYNPRHERIDVAGVIRAGMVESDTLLQTSVPVMYQDRKFGTLVLALSLKDMNAQVARDRRTTLAVCGVFVLLGTLASFGFASHITKPIVLLREAADRMAAGDYDVTVPVGNHDEVGALSEAFDVMAHRVHDAVDRLAAQAADLASARDAALAASRAKADFLAVMSHEIRTPMNGVVGLTNLLAETPLNAEQRQYVVAASQSAQSLMTVINDILDFSKVEAGKLAIEDIPLDLSTVVCEVKDLLAPRAAEQGIELVVRYAPTAPTRVIGDPGRIRQVLVNLAGNALKFTHRGHVLIKVDGENVNGLVQIRCEVTDTGIGIPPEQMQLLFQPFTQADAGTTRKFGGTGLGLSISKQLVDLMGGLIGVRSEVGVGSTFSFSLCLPEDPSPVEPAAPSASRAEAHVPEVLPAAVARALLVEDNVVNQMVAVAMLKKLGCTADIAADGIEALEMTEHTAYDIVFMDMQMPRLDGLEATRRIRLRESGGAHQVIVAMTANAMDEDRDACLAAGMDEFLSKPISMAELRRVLDALVVAVA